MGPYKDGEFQHIGFCMDVYELEKCKGCVTFPGCTELMEKERRDREWLSTNSNANIVG